MATIVISYARQDWLLVRGLVRLLRAGLQGIDKAVFWDEDFEPGESWFEQIETHIKESPRLFLIWCSHSASSPQVSREVEAALAHRKRIVPVLLDDTPPRHPLDGIHGVDLRGVLDHSAPGGRIWRDSTAPHPGTAVYDWLGDHRRENREAVCRFIGRVDPTFGSLPADVQDHAIFMVPRVIDTFAYIFRNEGVREADLS